jgi:hypothetical protein
MKTECRICAAPLGYTDLYQHQCHGTTGENHLSQLVENQDPVISIWKQKYKTVNPLHLIIFTVPSLRHVGCSLPLISQITAVKERTTF